MTRRQTRRAKQSARKGEKARTRIASTYFAVITYAGGYWEHTSGANGREVLRTAKGMARARLDGVTPHERATIDVRADAVDGRLIEQFETWTNKGSAFVRFRALEK